VEAEVEVEARARASLSAPAPPPPPPSPPQQRPPKDEGRGRKKERSQPKEQEVPVRFWDAHYGPAPVRLVPRADGFVDATEPYHHLGARQNRIKYAASDLIVQHSTAIRIGKHSHAPDIALAALTSAPEVALILGPPSGAPGRSAAS
jgi:hypothetical protein